MEATMKNQMMYLAAWGVLKKIAIEKKMDINMIEKINRKNAKSLMCDYLPIS